MKNEKQVLKNEQSNKSISEDIIFQISDWDFYHEEDTSTDVVIKKYILRLYGTTKEQKKIFVKVVDFTPYFFVKIPSFWQKDKEIIFIDELKRRVPHELKDSLLEYDIVRKHEFSEFTNYSTFKFVRLIFHSYEGFRAYERVLKKKIYNRILGNKAYKYPLYESNIEPMLRFMHIKKLEACGWAKIPANKYILFPKATAPSHNDINVQIKWTNIQYVDEKSIAPFIVAAFDIECTSEDGSFPQPERENDKVIQIGTTFNRYGEPECYFKHIITLGSCSQIPGVIVESYKTEEECLLAWSRLLIKMNPDIVTGYNIFGFDYRYLEARAKKLGISMEFSRFGRIKNESSAYIKKELSSSALGDNELKYYAMQGRIQIDLMKFIQKEFKLSSYKLDDVAAEFIKEQIKQVKINTKDKTTVIYTGTTYGLELDRYTSIYHNDGLSDNKYKNGKKYKIINLGKEVIDDISYFTITINEILDNDIFELLNNKKYKVYWCQAKDDVKAKDLFELQKGSAADRAVIAKYCIQDCILCNKLMEKLQVITNNVGMANVTSVPMAYLFLRGQGIKVFSLVSKKCRERNHLIPVLTKKYISKAEKQKREKEEKDNKDPKNQKDVKEQQKQLLKRMNVNNKLAEDSESSEEDAEGYEGATVLEPDAGVHFQPIPVLDYASLYPSSMIHRNISHECLVRDPKYDNLPGYHYVSVTFYNTEGTIPTTCKYAKEINGRIGILPEILMDLLKARADTRKLIEQTNDKFKQKILDGLQLAYKITANSLYGSCGCTTSAIYKREIAASTTATGREMLMGAKRFAEEVYPKIIEAIITNNKILYKKRINQLFDTNSCEGIDMFPGYPVVEKLFNNPKNGYTNREEFIEKFYSDIAKLLENKKIQPKCIYGDSVTGDTPLLLRMNKNVCIKTISELSNTWKSYEEFKLGDSNRKEKQQNESEIHYEIWTDKGWAKIKRVIRHKTQKKLFRIVTNTGVVDVTEDHSLLDINGKIIKPNECVINTELLHSFPEFPTNTNNIINKKFTSSDKLECMKYYYDSKANGYYVNINVNDNTYVLTRHVTPIKDPNKIIKIIPLGETCNNYVYDIETSTGHFNAGIGEITVKNTDSVFINFNIMDRETGEKLVDHATLANAIQLGILCGRLIGLILPFPHNLCYEKTFWPFVIHTKKRYVGNLYEFSPDKFTQKSMGIVLKRRDNAPIVKVVVGGIVDMILNERSAIKAVEYTRNELKKILSSKYPIDKFIITKTLKSKYADRTKIVHAVLADRIAERDPGNALQSNDRVPYVYITTDEEVELQGDRVEHPDYVIENQIPMDYLFYITNQIMKPANQFLEKVVKNPESIFEAYITRELNRRSGKKPIKSYFKNYYYNNYDEDSESESGSGSEDKYNNEGYDDEYENEDEDYEPEDNPEPRHKSKPKPKIKINKPEEDDSVCKISIDNIPTNKVKKNKRSTKKIIKGKSDKNPQIDKDTGGFVLDV